MTFHGVAVQSSNQSYLRNSSHALTAIFVAVTGVLKTIYGVECGVWRAAAFLVGSQKWQSVRCDRCRDLIRRTYMFNDSLSRGILIVGDLCE